MHKLLMWPLVVGALFATGFAYDTVTGIGPSDVSAYHRFKDEPRHFSASPGALVAISPDGRNLDPLCSMEVDDVRTVEIDATYINRLSKVLPSFGSLLRTFLGDGDQAGTPSAADGLHFTGALHTLDEQYFPTKFSHECECAFVRRSLAGDRICTVRGALIENGNELVRALRFARFSNFPTPEQVANCGETYTKAVEELKNKSCSVGNLPWDAELRDRFRLIEPEAAAGEAEIALTAAN
jgi:hypothetical protein